MTEMPWKVMRPFSIILAADKKGGIGKGNELPWRLPSDMKYFKETTMKLSGAKVADKMNACVMGRKTWESIPEKFRPLEGRLNIVLSRDMKQEDVKGLDNVVVVNGGLTDALTLLGEKEYLAKVDRVFVIGGGSLYNEALAAPCLPILHNVYLTQVEGEFDCDTFVAFTPGKSFREVSKSEAEDKNIKMTMYHYSKVNKEEQQYLDLVDDIIKNGFTKGDRTGVGTISKFGAQMRFSLRDGVIPLLTTKRVFWKGVAEELFWFIKGCTNGKDLKDKGVHIWDGNGTRAFLDSRGLPDRAEDDLGPIYGFQWRHFGAEYKDCHTDYTGKGVDQLAEVINTIKTNPNDRRIIMSAWNPMALGEMALPPCHVMCQFYVAGGELSCQMYQRSCDMGLGVPFNIASYALLTIMIAHITGLKPGDFVHTLGDAHVYTNHVEPLKEQLEREPRPFPCLKILKHHDNIEDYEMADFELLEYKPYPTIKMEMAV
eukprot:TRINITY_DN5102_c2_g1_i1.p1 TRINITY_DN5102_c2_g1~~TRINITY_DN5102_c2_g1_i1.p1  ORF type:complete len:500 (+),score=186.29 TRINITY_DN5102_c2_g1_i1:46-1500(+)